MRSQFVPNGRLGQKAGEVNLTGIRCIINGIKHIVLMDDGRTCLVGVTGIDGSYFSRYWVSRQTVDPGAPPPLSRDSEYYFWLGADAERIGALSEMG